MSVLQAIILAIVEGLTEFLPVSSTGHMIIVSTLMGLNENEFTKIFEVNIQFGTILSVIILYYRRFFRSIDFYYRLFVAFLPAAVIGLLLSDFIDALLENVVVVAISLLLGGIVLIFIDRVFQGGDDDSSHVPYPKALVIGFFQCLAMIPGVSRSAATIIGGQAQGLSRKAAAEFSFFLAVPTMAAASGYKLLKDHEALSVDNLPILLLGNLVGFVVAMLAIRFFIDYLTRHGFKVFGYYRIVLGLLILGLLAAGVDLQI
ncbi:undecaprenyl-diphosphatase [Catalinimonas alkaloidigena]|uniref:Undecaprenyl-diphosphatase n=1 Tax=Catalinimonas alkaloidigena TaxID=1075417 RepID=A0A1G9AGE9_9BACT|nr:undecaprenyl-diphosphate phosphatase [Catalinimonas alkaloidigena]SDK26429.1 undecaprenyl-diphosphatase [Catalinimonas alkaloidigena]